MACKTSGPASVANAKATPNHDGQTECPSWLGIGYATYGVASTGAASGRRQRQRAPLTRSFDRNTQRRAVLVEYCVMRTRTPPLAPGKLTDDVTVHIVPTILARSLAVLFSKLMKQKLMNGLSSAKSLAASTPTRWPLISPRAGHAMSPRISRKL